MDASLADGPSQPTARELTVSGVIENALGVYRAHAATLILAG